jgi:predicted GNAT family N-acyltransferase
VGAAAWRRMDAFAAGRLSQTDQAAENLLGGLIGKPEARGRSLVEAQIMRQTIKAIEDTSRDEVLRNCVIASSLSTT